MNYNAALGCLLIAVAILCSGCEGINNPNDRSTVINKGGTSSGTWSVSCV